MTEDEATRNLVQEALRIASETYSDPRFAVLRLRAMWYREVTSAERRRTDGDAGGAHKKAG